VSPDWHCRRHVLSQACYIWWYGVNEAKRLRQLETENPKLKRLADKLLEVDAVKDVLQKNGEACEQKTGGGSHEEFLFVNFCW